MSTARKEPVYIGELVWKAGLWLVEKNADAAMVSAYFYICWRCWSNAESAMWQRRGRNRADNAWLSVGRTLTLYALSGLYATVSRVPSNQKQMSRPVSSYLVCTSYQQRCAHSRISQFATSAMWQRRGRNRADNAWLDVGRALNISRGQSVASRLIRNRCHVLSVLINNDAAARSDACMHIATSAIR